MSTADQILTQIDSALGDYNIGPDAMRVAPDLPPAPVPRRIIVRTDTAAALARIRQLRDTMDDFAAAVTPAVQAAGRSLAHFAEAMRQPVRPTGRPAWQTPYGPPQRRR